MYLSLRGASLAQLLSRHLWPANTALRCLYTSSAASNVSFPKRCIASSHLLVYHGTESPWTFHTPLSGWDCFLLNVKSLIRCTLCFFFDSWHFLTCMTFSEVHDFYLHHNFIYLFLLGKDLFFVVAALAVFTSCTSYSIHLLHNLSDKKWSSLRSTSPTTVTFFF